MFNTFRMPPNFRDQPRSAFRLEMMTPPARSQRKDNVRHGRHIPLKACGRGVGSLNPDSAKRSIEFGGLASCYDGG